MSSYRAVTMALTSTQIGALVIAAIIVGYMLYTYKKGETLVTWAEYVPFTQGLGTSNVGGDYGSSITKLNALEKASLTTTQ